MGRKMATLAVMFLLVSASASVMAGQVIKPFAVVDVGADGAMGYSFPFLGIGAGLDIRAKHIHFQAEALYSSTDKLAYGDVRQYYGFGRVLYVAGNIVFGGGATFSRIEFRELGDKRSAIRPFVTVGVRPKNSLITFDAVLPGSDPAYRMYKGVVRAEVPCCSHVRLTFELAGLVMHSTTGNFRSTGFSGNLYIKVFP